MDWLNDKKNQPIVAAIAAVVIVGVGVGMYFYLRPDSADQGVELNPPTDQSGSPMPGEPMPGTPTTQPSPAPGAAGPVAVAPTTTSTAPAGPAGTREVVAAAPMETWRADPFLPPGYRPPPTGVPRPKPAIRDLPLGALFAPGPKPGSKLEVVEAPQPVRRMAGLLLGDRIHAILETNGKSEIVQPGETLEDGLAVVDRIEKDRVILKTTGKPSRYITVRMASAPRTPTSASTATGPPDMGGPRPSRFPRGPRAPGGDISPAEM